MMRRLFPILMLIAFPAHAGTKATYLRPDGGSTIVEIADNGDARIGPSDGADYGLLINGRFYLVQTSADRTTVTRVEDIMAAAGLLLPPRLNERSKSASSREGTVKQTGRGWLNLMLAVSAG